jgi:hypothetical protein
MQHRKITMSYFVKQAGCNATGGSENPEGRRPTKSVRSVCAPIALATAITLAALPAVAETLSRSVDVDGTPTAVWSMIGGFCAVPDWHPAIGSCTLAARAPLTRTLVTKDGTATFVETQTANSATNHLYSYSIISSPLPVTQYAATLQVTPRAENLATVTWSSSYAPNKGQEDAASAALIGIYDTGLEVIRQRFAK